MELWNLDVRDAHWLGMLLSLALSLSLSLALALSLSRTHPVIVVVVALVQPPFYSQDVQQMYQKIMTAKLSIPKSVNDDARDLLEKLLIRDPEQRMTDPEQIKAHPWFSSIDWDLLLAKEITPPYIPPVKGKLDTSQVDPTFTTEEPTLSLMPDSNISSTLQQNFEGFTYVAPSGMDGQ